MSRGPTGELTTRSYDFFPNYDGKPPALLKPKVATQERRITSTPIRGGTTSRGWVSAGPSVEEMTGPGTWASLERRIAESIESNPLATPYWSASGYPVRNLRGATAQATAERALEAYRSGYRYAGQALGAEANKQGVLNPAVARELEIKFRQSVVEGARR